jgi:hypothetical protein
MREGPHISDDLGAQGSLHVNAHGSGETLKGSDQFANRVIRLTMRRHGKVVNRLLKSVAWAAPPNSGFTPKISSSVRSVELCV